MNPGGLTPAQRELFECDGGRYVEACPGAGKTRAIVARFLRRAADEPRKGVALLSFTNAAVDEVGRRCAEMPHLMRNPHFCGTFDSFINAFVVGPERSSKAKVYPKFIDSWDSQDSSDIHLARTDRWL